jgi:hypothetical protein
MVKLVYKKYDEPTQVKTKIEFDYEDLEDEPKYNPLSPDNVFPESGSNVIKILFFFCKKISWSVSLQKVFLGLVKICGVATERGSWLPLKY